MLTVVIVLKGLAELLLLSFAAQGLLYALAGAMRSRNMVYQIFATVNRPVWKATRFITPRFIVDAHVGFVSFFLLAVAWFALLLAKVHFYTQQAGGPAG